MKKHPAAAGTNDKGSPNAQNDEKAIGDFFCHSPPAWKPPSYGLEASFLIVRTDLCNHV
jgi:hypothetical protein